MLKVMTTKVITMRVSVCVESDGHEGLGNGVHGVLSDKLSFIFFVVTVSLSNLESISKEISMLFMRPWWLFALFITVKHNKMHIFQLFTSII